MWAETVDRGNEWARMSAPPAAAASSPNPTPALAPSDEEDVAICAMMDKYEAGECVGVHTAGPSRTQQPPSPSPCAKQQADKEWLDHEREKENARKRAREFADEVLADAHRAASKHSRDHYQVALGAHVKAQLAWFMKVEYTNDEDKLGEHIEKLADEHENLANAVEGVANQLSDIATTLENREY